MNEQRESIFPNHEVICRALKDPFIELNPRTQIKNLVTLMVFISAVLIFVMFLSFPAGIRNATLGYILAISIVLRFVILFGNFAEAIIEGRGEAQADILRISRKNIMASRIPSADRKSEAVRVKSTELKKGDLVYVKAGGQVPADGDVMEDAASADESATTGESTPVIWGSGGDRSAVTGGTTVISNQVAMRVSNNPGRGFIDEVIAVMGETSRKKTSSELALQTSLVVLSTIFVLVTIPLYSYSVFSSVEVGAANPMSITNLATPLACLASTTIGALLPAIGIAGMSRLNQTNVLAINGRAIKTTGDVGTLLLDKTGTIALGDCQADVFIPVDGHGEIELVDAAQLPSLAGETPEGRSIVVLAKKRFGVRAKNMEELQASFVPFTAKAKMSSIDYNGNETRKGAVDAIRTYVGQHGGTFSRECENIVKRIVNQGGMSFVVVKNGRVMDVVELKDITKQGVKEKFADLRKMGIRTIIITGDSPLTAASIVAEAGVDDFLAEVTPEAKLNMIRDYRIRGHLAAMTGDDTNDAPTLARTDMTAAMNIGTQAAKGAGNMVDLDSSPTKLTEIVKIGKQSLMTRGSLTTFSIANDIAKYFAIIPTLFMGLYPRLSAPNIMGLHSASSAVLPTITYSALIIVALIPLALKRVRYGEASTTRMLSGNPLVYGLGGIIIPFIAIKIIDMLIAVAGLAMWCVKEAGMGSRISQS